MLAACGGGASLCPGDSDEGFECSGVLARGGDIEGRGGAGAQMWSASPSSGICWLQVEHVIDGSCDICPALESAAGRTESCAAIEALEGRCGLVQAVEDVKK